MVLNLIGIGLGNEKDISVKGLETVKKSDIVYLESYTSKLNCKKSLDKYYGTKIRLADRSLVESEDNEIIKNAKEKNVSLLIIGDVFSATTHIDLMLRAKKENINVNVINNASIISAIGTTGLEVYKFGKTTSIPFENKDVMSPYNVLKENLENDMHTLFLLDLEPAKNKFLTIRQAIEFLIECEEKEKQKIFDEEVKILGCARIGSDDYKIKYGRAKELIQEDFGDAPYCLVIPSKNLHFMEEEALKLWK